MKKINLVFSILLTLFMVGVKSQTIKIDSGLVASYPFNGNARDESGTGNHGAVNGAVLTEDRFGIPNSAYWFDGISAFINVPDHPSLDITDELTITGWIRKDSHVPWASMVTKGGDTGQLEENNYAIHNDTTNNMVFTGAGFVYSKANVPILEWHFISFTLANDTGKFYIDGVPDFLSFTKLEGEMTPNNSHLFIGVDHPGVTEFFHGCLDDIRIYNRALTAEEVAYLFHYNQDYISLNAGWNLISMDVEQDSPTPKSVFSTLIENSNLRMVTGFQSQQGVFFDPTGLPFLNTLQNLIPGEGYWVKVENADTLLVHGTAISADFPINLQLGWNLIAYWPQESTTPEEAFAPLIEAGVLQMVTGYEQEGKFYDPNGPTFLNTLPEIKNGFGYWLKVSADYYGFTYPGTVWNCGLSLLDWRDGKNYQTVKIGDQCWMKENLNIGSYREIISSQTDNGVIEKYCYFSLETNCDIYGALYTWNEMMQYSTIPGMQGICPSGWHLPTNAEWTTLTTFLGGETVAGGKMKSAGTIQEGTGLWYSPNTGATDSIGFTALPGGFSFYLDFHNLGLNGNWWSSSENNPANAWQYPLYYNNVEVIPTNLDKSTGLSARCLQDNTTPSNQPPAAPSTPSPESGSINQPSNTTLTWACSDPENDPLTYDIYFGTQNPPSLVATAQTGTTYNPGTLVCITAYFWKIIAHDDNGNTTESPIWNFTTMQDPWQCGNSLKDTRDGQTYPTVQIGTQCWMAKSMNIGTRIDGIQNAQNNGIIEKYCYDNLETNCDVYGGLYQWDEMMQYSTTLGVQGICPSGWHLPTDSEWCIITTFIDATVECNALMAGSGTNVGAKMKSTNGWNNGGNGTNESGFTALPGGFRHGGVFYYQGNYGNFWTSTANCDTNAWYRGFGYDHPLVFRNDNCIFAEKTEGLAVRCVKNESTTSQLTVTPANQDVTATVGTTTFSISSNTTWIVEENTPWLTVSPMSGTNNGTLTVAFDENFYSSRIGQLTIIADGGFPNNVVTITQTAGSGTCGQPITDSRDNQVYHTVQIGSQCWMKENMKIGNMIAGTGSQTNNGIIEKYCYNNNATNCDIYGGMYLWNEMMQYVTTEGAKGICPDFWHVPTDADYSILTTYLGGLTVAGGHMKEAGTNHWASPNGEASNSSGYSALPTGYKYGGFYNLGYWGDIPSSTQYNASEAWLLQPNYGNGSLYHYHSTKNTGWAVRCLKDN